MAHDKFTTENSEFFSHEFARIFAAEGESMIDPCKSVARSAFFSVPLW